MKIPTLLRHLVLACAVLGGVAACSPSSRWIGSWTSSRLDRLFSHQAQSAAAQQDVKPPPDNDMVVAVSSGTGTSVPVEVRFALRERPEIGKAAELDLEVVPSAPVDRLIATFFAGEGLSLSDGAQPAERDRPEPGVPIAHRLMIVAQRDGIFYVNATVLADFNSESVAHTFTIPIIAGAGSP
ncbi:MAG: hypothetical protein WBE92_08845 [Steroidobacteraceae bacterium]